jgi:hypothetical protein
MRMPCDVLDHRDTSSLAARDHGPQIRLALAAAIGVCAPCCHDLGSDEFPPVDASDHDDANDDLRLLTDAQASPAAGA